MSESREAGQFTMNLKCRNIELSINVVDTTPERGSGAMEVTALRIRVQSGFPSLTPLKNCSFASPVCLTECKNNKFIDKDEEDDLCN